MMDQPLASRTNPTPLIDAVQLNADIEATARFGGTGNGGVSRLTLTPEDKAVRDWFVARCIELGCRVDVDPIGNLFASYPGRNAALPVIMTGSHLDTQPGGGRYDGVLGVLAGLAALRALRSSGIVTEHPLTVVNWTNEEGSRFSPAMFGSGVHAGAIALDEALAVRDRAGISVGEALDAIGYRGSQACRQTPAAYVELHIEQGPVLEAEGTAIGAVTGVQGLRWFDVVIEGTESHAGSTPMANRRDALTAAARLILAVEAIGRAHAPGVLTVGHAGIFPNSRNVVPGRVNLQIDMRHPSQTGLDAMETALRQAVAGQADSRIERIWAKQPVAFDPACIEAVRQAAADCRLSCRDIASGAGHDAAHLAALAPTAMIFIPSRDGLSHNEREYSSPRQCADGAEVLLRTLLELDRRLA
ncbi:Zn-dependent hydrolase [Labrys sp. 22185]|uniref:Zn-dependent hydrolase n=1 Tax=Labrys sp. 22185 TaxID=3453888 RepID=UPI003F872314